MDLKKRLRGLILQFSEFLEKEGTKAPAAFLAVTLDSIPTATEGDEISRIEELLALVRLRRTCYTIADGNARLKQFLESQSVTTYAPSSGTRQ